MKIERNDRRVLAAVRFMDEAAGTPITEELSVEVAPSSPMQGEWLRNRSAIYVLRSAEGLEDHRHAFEAAPASPAPGALGEMIVDVRDPRGVYLPRRFTLSLPRDPDPETGNLHGVMDVALPPGPVAALRPTWGRVSVRVRFAPNAENPDGTPIEGALVRVEGAGRLRGRTLTDHRGEALVPAVGISPFTVDGSGGATFNPQPEQQAVIVFDRAATNPETGRRSNPADPDDLWTRRNSLLRRTRTFNLGPGQQSDSHTIDIPRT